MKKILTGMILFLTLSVPASALTIKEAVEATLSNNPQIKSAQADIKAADAKIRQVKSYNLPKAGIKAIYSVMDEAPSIDLPDMNISLGPINKTIVIPPIELTRNYISAGTLNISYPIYTGGRIKHGLMQAEYGKEAYTNIYRATENEFAFAAAKAFLTLQLAVEAQNVSQQAYDTIKEHLDQANKLFEHKQIAKYEVIRAETELENAHKKLIEAKNNVRLSCAVLNSLMGRAPESDLSISPFEFSEQTLFSDISSEQALSSSYTIKAIQAKERVFYEAGKVASAEHRPTAGLFASKILYANKQPFSTPNLIGGVILNIPLYDGGLSHSKAKEQEALREKTINDLHKAENDIKLQLTNYAIEIENAKESTNAAKKAMQLAQESLRLAQRRFAEGIGTGLEITDANLALSAAQMSIIQAKYQYNIACFGIAKTTNTLWQILDIKDPDCGDEKHE